MEFSELKKRAMECVGLEQTNKNTKIGSVAAAILTDQGNVYTGVSIVTPCSMGFCAEHTAIGTMLTARESRIVKLVAVYQDGSVLSPCGRCREFIKQIDARNGECLIQLKNGIKTLDELLPDQWD
ncbi:hypothetical protein BACCIP111895_03058 [Neobacillus rhizosphaerae]|uniref:CMP/dCMP-type deaminase domain-containing protein n=1 Tax=Neobacillus rhizosphaerae TaxID=2880965 RepID=A0ABN8KQJ4_9BACI|nr:cytidine deaminase [Neobacillus rhizosphaerae]CAH2715874.1 hypothetical protein BACCIP111895_03058 [Neobacillus rhizosphaerae]